MTTLLDVQGLRAAILGNEILKGVDLTVRAGEVHAIMGPNGSGKSTLAKVITGHPAYAVTAGTMSYRGQDLQELAPEERARAGLFLSFQHPVEIPGVRLDHFLRASYNERRKFSGEEELDVLKFDRLLKTHLPAMAFDPALAKRFVNDGFSGGEKKRAETLQLSVLAPVLAILDEVDSGLDVDALRDVARGVNAMRTPERALVLVTHYQRVLDAIVPDVVHVMIDGRIVMTGDKELAREVEARGYDWVASQTGA